MHYTYFVYFLTQVKLIYCLLSKMYLCSSSSFVLYSAATFRQHARVARQHSQYVVSVYLYHNTRKNKKMDLMFKKQENDVRTGKLIEFDFEVLLQFWVKLIGLGLSLFLDVFINS